LLKKIRVKGGGEEMKLAACEAAIPAISINKAG
jgi:hypothetical protein